MICELSLKKHNSGSMHSKKDIRPSRKILMFNDEVHQGAQRSIGDDGSLGIWLQGRPRTVFFSPVFAEQGRNRIRAEGGSHKTWQELATYGTQFPMGEKAELCTTNTNTRVLLC